MQYYSGFSFENEQDLFTHYLDSSAFVIAGFSYGAIRAFEAVQHALKHGQRVDRLILLSPAFFQNKPQKFKRLQLMGYQRAQEHYIQEFRKLCFAPYTQKNIPIAQTSYEALQTLLFYQWDDTEVQKVRDAGVIIEVYFGSQDAIVDADVAYSFFQKSSIVTMVHNANHCLLKE